MFSLLPLLVSISFQMAFSGQLVTFWHVTDFHLDLNYSQFGDIGSRCHYNPSNPSYNENLPKFGFNNGYDCDTPYALAESAVKAMRNINAQPDFIICTGDFSPHEDDINTNTNNIITILTNVTNLFSTYFPNTKVYSVLGNHDYWPYNQFPTTTNPIYQAAAQLWGKYLTSEATFNLSQYGYYRQDLDLPSNTTLLGLNTNLYYYRNSVTAGIADPAGQFAFMESSLKEAKLNGKKVVIISHCPPGIYWSLNDPQNNRFVNLLADHADIIIGSHFGHNHVDQMMLIRNGSAGSFIDWLLVAPAVNVWAGYGRNPAIRQMSIDSDTGDIRMLKQYWLNLADANLSGNDTWLPHYTISLPDTTTFLQYEVNYYNQMNQKKTTAAQWLELLNRENVNEPNQSCSNTCKKQHLCGMAEVIYSRYATCTK